MNNIKVSLDRVQYSSKPQNENIGQISKRIGNSVEYLNSANIKSFVEKVSKHGQTFCQTTFTNGSRKKENFEQQQLLVLDFDGGISTDNVFDRAKQYELQILFAYETFSSIDSDRFRVVFMNDAPILDIRVAEIYQNALITMFPEADKTCKDISKMYFGGKKLLYYDDLVPTINGESLFRNMTLYLKNEHGDSHYKSKISKFAENNNIALNKNKLLDISIEEDSAEQFGGVQNGKILPNPILFKTNGNNLPSICYKVHLNNNSDDNTCYANKTEIKIRNPYRSDILKDIHTSCQLFREFDAGMKKLHHNELFGIATNLIQIESGIKKFNEILKLNTYFDNNNKYNYWDFNLKYFKQNEYKPQNCDFFCPYKDICNHGTNILHTAKPKCYTIERLANYKEHYYPIDEVVKDVQQKFMTAINANDNKFHVIKAQPATGKTEIYLDFMKDSCKRVLIAVPTNILKNDVFNRAVKKGIKVIETPSLDEIKDDIPDDIWGHIQELYQSGRFNSVNLYLQKMITERDVSCLKKYFEDLKACDNFDGNVITTHRKLLNLNESILKKFDSIIIDEDIILKSVIPNQCDIAVSDLRKILKYSIDRKLCIKIKSLLKSIKKKSLFTLASFEFDDKNESDTIEGMSTPIDIPSFCLAKHFYFRSKFVEKNLAQDSIVFFKPAKFKTMKYIMVSATADEKIYNYYFGEGNVKFYTCKNAPYKGTLNQYYGKSMSRACIDKNSGIIKAIIEGTENEIVITFKKYAKGELYFGNTEGCNHLAGQNINVIGTPYQTEFLYKLFPYMLGLKIDEDAKMIPNNTVTYNGCKFRFTTYNDTVLRDFHLWMINSELEQAVGRARLLRHNCIVNLFSNFPLSQAVLKEAEYEELY